MSTNYHTAIAYGAEATSANVNSPLSELDTQLTANTTEIASARGSAVSLDTRLDASLNNDGSIKDEAVGVDALAAAVAGDGIQGGNGSALAVDVSDFAGTGLEDDGSENLRIAAAAAGDGLTGGGGSALAVNVDDSTIEIATDTVQVKSGGIGGTQLATGAVSAQAKVDLSDAAAANGDAIRYEEFTAEHSAAGAHNGNHVSSIIYCDTSVGGTSGSAAASLTEYDYDDPGADNEEAKIKFAFMRPMSSLTDLVVHFEAKRDGASPNCYVKVDVGGQSQETEITDGSWTEYNVRIDASSLTVDNVYECTISLHWAGEVPASGNTVYMRYVVAKLAGTA